MKELRVCSKCKAAKPLKAFYSSSVVNKKGKEHLRGNCKSCHRYQSATHKNYKRNNDPVFAFKHAASFKEEVPKVQKVNKCS